MRPAIPASVLALVERGDSKPRATFGTRATVRRPEDVRHPSTAQTDDALDVSTDAMTPSSSRAPGPR